MSRVALAVVVALGALSSGCKDPPCGKDAKVDERPLPAAWAANWATPPDTVMCTFNDENGEGMRHFTVQAKTTDEAVGKWDSALTAKGWKKKPLTKQELEEELRRAASGDNCIQGGSYEHSDGGLLHVGVSSCAEGNPGWSTVQFEPAKKK